MGTLASAVAVKAKESVVDLRGMWIGLATLNVFYLIVRVHALLGREGSALLTN